MSKEIKAKDGDLNKVRENKENKRIKEILAVTSKDWRVRCYQKKV